MQALTERLTELREFPRTEYNKVNALAADDASVAALAEACALANSASTIVSTTDSVWGGDVQTAIINKLIECSVEGTDIDAKLAELQAELTALIG